MSWFENIIGFHEGTCEETRSTLKVQNGKTPWNHANYVKTLTKNGTSYDAVKAVEFSN